MALVRIITGSAGDDFRGGAAVSINGASSQGFNLHFRGGGTGDHHVQMLDDALAWGPSSSGGIWTESTWYWMRLRTDGTTVTGKFWAADGVTAEPAAATLSWTRGGRSGFAGIAANSNGSGAFSMDVGYVLIQASGLPQIAAANTLTWNGAGGTKVWDYATANWARGTENVKFGVGDAVVFDDSTANQGAITISNGGSAVQPSRITVNTANNYAFSGDPIGNAAGQTMLTKTGAGTLTISGMSNTFTGATAVNNGTLVVDSLAPGGTASSIGAATSPVVLGGASAQGTLKYTGGDATFNRGFAIGAGGGQLIHAGTGALTINQGDIASPSHGNFAIDTATGSSIDAASNLVLGTGRLTKSGLGRLTLTGANSMSGATISAGEVVADDGSLDGTVAVNSGAKLTLGTASVRSPGLLTKGYVGTGSPGSLNNVNWTNPTETFTETQVNHPSVDGTEWWPGTRTGYINNFAVQWTGSIKIDAANQAYTFSTESDDGSRLEISPDGGASWVAVANNDGDHAPNKVSGTYTFSSTGNYLFRERFYENGGGAQCIVRWIPPGGSEAVIPESAFSYTVKSPSGARGLSIDGLTGAGTVDLNGGVLTINATSADSRFEGTLTDSVGGGGLTKAGAYTFTLPAGSAHTGPTILNQGKLVLGSGGGLPNSQVEVNGGATLQAATSVGALVMGTGGKLDISSDVPAVGASLTTGSANLIAGSILNFKFAENGSAHDMLVVTTEDGLQSPTGPSTTVGISLYKGLTTAAFDKSPSPGLGDLYDLIQYDISLLGDPDPTGFTVLNPLGGRRYAFEIDTSHPEHRYLAVRISLGPTWTGAVDGNWGTGGNASNWTVALSAATKDLLTFDGNSHTTTSNDQTTVTNFAGLYFASTAGAFTLKGPNGITLWGDVDKNIIKNDTPNTTQTVNLPITLDVSAEGAAINAAQGPITIGAAGGIVNNGCTVVIKGPNPVAIDGAITGSGTVSVSPGAILAGVGAVSSPVSLVGSATLQSSGTLTLASTLAVTGTGNAIASGAVSVSGPTTVNSGADFTVAGTFNTTGALNTSGNTVFEAVGGGKIATLNVTGGTTTLNTSGVTADSLSVTAPGAVSAGTNLLTVSQQATLGTLQISTDSAIHPFKIGGTIQVGSAPGVLRLTGGSVAVTGLGNPAFQYYAFEVDSRRGGGNNMIQFSEFSIFDDAGNRITPVAAWDPFNPNTPGEGPANAIDNNLGTKLLDWGSDNGRTGTWPARVLIVDFGTPVTLANYNWATANDAEDRDPMTWKLAACNDAVSGTNNGTWVTLDDRSASAYNVPTTRNVWVTTGTTTATPGFVLSGADLSAMQVVLDSDSTLTLSGPGIVPVLGDLALNGSKLTLSTATAPVSFNNIVSVTGTSAIEAGPSITLRGGTVSVDTADAVLTIHADIEGSGQLTKTGAGTLALTGAKTFNGTMMLNAGVLSLGHANALANATLAAAGGSVAVAVPVANVAGLSGSGALTLQGPNTLAVGGTNASSTFGGTLTGTGNVTKVGSGDLRLIGSSAIPGTYSGQIDIAPTGSVTLGPCGTGRASVNVQNGGTLKLVAIAESRFDDHWTYNGSATASADQGTLTVTPAAGSQAGSAFLNDKVSVAAFSASFVYQESPPGPTGVADGTTIVLQNDPRGLTALGGAGSSLGYEGITPSAALAINIYSGHVQGTNLFTSGDMQGYTYNSTGTVNVASGHPIQFDLTTVDGLTLNEKLTDLTTSDTYSASVTLPVDLATILGGTEAYLGFTGGTGGAVALQTIRDFGFSWSGLGNVRVAALTGAGTVELDGNTLDVAGAAGAGSPPEFSGKIADGSSPGAVLKTGNGTQVLSGTSTYTGGTIVSEGTLEIASAAALPTGYSVTIGAGGTMVLSSGLSASGAGGTSHSAAPVPEPATIALLAAAAMASLALCRRRWTKR